MEVYTQLWSLVKTSSIPGSGHDWKSVQTPLTTPHLAGSAYHQYLVLWFSHWVQTPAKIFKTVCPPSHNMFTELVIQGYLKFHNYNLIKLLVKKKKKEKHLKEI